MKVFAIGFTALLFALGATQVLAVTTEQRYMSIKGTAATAVGGQCSEGYADQCPTNSCTCVEVSSATVANVTGEPSLAGKGTADLFLTFDNGAATVSGVDDCTPFFGVAELTTTRGGKASSETLNLVGVNCSPLTTANSPILRRIRDFDQPGSGKRRKRLRKNQRVPRSLGATYRSRFMAQSPSNGTRSEESTAEREKRGRIMRKQITLLAIAIVALGASPALAINATFIVTGRLGVATTASKCTSLSYPSMCPSC